METKACRDRFGEPDTPIGYSISLLKEKFGDQWEKFADFMSGQTMGIWKGEGVIYEADVVNYLFYLKTGRELFYD